MYFVNLFLLHCAKGTIISLAKRWQTNVVLVEKEPLVIIGIKIWTIFKCYWTVCVSPFALNQDKTISFLRSNLWSPDWEAWSGWSLFQVQSSYVVCMNADVCGHWSPPCDRRKYLKGPGFWCVWQLTVNRKVLFKREKCLSLITVGT